LDAVSKRQQIQDRKSEAVLLTGDVRPSMATTTRQLIRDIISGNVAASACNQKLLSHRGTTPREL